MFNKILTAAYVVIGLYCVVSGITGKGRMFENQNVAANKQEQFKKTMRIFLLISGPILSAGGIMELLNMNQWYYLSCYMAVLFLAMGLVVKLRSFVKKD